MVVVEVLAPMETPQPKNHNELVTKLEDFFTAPEILVEIGDFFASCDLQFVGFEENELEETHPIENYEQFQRYGELIEKKLALFLSENSKDANELYTACLEEKLENENGWAVCLDYLIASLDYEYFLQVAFDLYNLQ